MARRFGKKIDTVHWSLIADSVVAQAAGTSARLMFAAQHLPETLLRIRGEWACSLDGAQASAIGTSVYSGLILVPEGTGSTVLWSPISDGDAPWIWWDAAHLLYEEFVVDLLASTEVASRARVIDSKAMRKVRNTELQWVVENATISGLSASSVNVALSARVLSGS